MFANKSIRPNKIRFVADGSNIDLVANAPNSTYLWKIGRETYTSATPGGKSVPYKSQCSLTIRPRHIDLIEFRCGSNDVYDLRFGNFRSIETVGFRNTLIEKLKLSRQFNLIVMFASTAPADTLAIISDIDIERTQLISVSFFRLDELLKVKLKNLSTMISLNLKNTIWKIVDLTTNSNLASLILSQSWIDAKIEELYVSNTKITSIIATSLDELRIINANGVATLTNIDFGGCTALISVDLNGSGLSQSEVDEALADLDNNGANNGDIDLRNTAIPSAAGLSNKTSLERKGWTVQVDS